MNFPYYIRKIDKNRATRLQSDRISADAVSDLRSSKNELSLFQVASPQEFDKVIVHFATATDKLATHIHLFPFQQDMLDQLGLEYELKTANTSVPDINDLHYNIIKLDGNLLVKIANFIKMNEKEIKEVLGSKIQTLVKGILEVKQLDYERLKPSMLKDILEKKLAPSAIEDKIRTMLKQNYGEQLRLVS